MDTNLIDPHNHVPEVTPDDEWGDAEGLHPNFDAAATILPPKRQRTDEAPGRANEGLRIESTQIRRENSEPAQTLEVQHFTNGQRGKSRNRLGAARAKSGGARANNRSDGFWD